MPVRPPTFRPRGGARTKPERDQDHDRHRRQAKPWRAWYKRPAWQAARTAQLGKQPLCETCLDAQPQRFTPATVVHHKVPHRGDWALFIDPANHASACKQCHDTVLQSEERVTKP